MRYKYLCTIAVATVFSACAVTAPPPYTGTIADSAQNGTHYKVGSPYTIYGVRYTPRENYKYSEVGMASWYGPNFHGKKTANGGIFDQHSYTAAHRTLPMPSLVRVTNLQNGKTIVVKVNDRGPYAKQRIIDLSYATAKYLDVIRTGTARVRVEILPKQSKMLKDAMLGNRPMPVFDANGKVVNGESTTAVAASQTTIPMPSGHYIQTGVYSNLQSAVQHGKIVKTYGRTKIYKMRVDNKVLYAVRLGPYDMEVEAETLSLVLQEKGIQTIMKKF